MIKYLTSMVLLLTSCLCNSCSQTINITPTQTTINYSDSLTFEYNEGNQVDSFGSIAIWVINKSNNCYIFPYNYGVSLQILENSNWKELPSKLVNYYPHDDIIMEKKGKAIFDSYPVSFYPDISGMKITTETEVIATIKGYICDHPEIVVEKKIPFYIQPQ